jgi:hypothetical protein
MKKIFFLAFLFGSVGPACASDVWLCEDSSGHRYQATQNVPSDNCRKLEADEVTLDPAAITMPSRSDSTGRVQSFCKTQNKASCVVAENGIDQGSLNGARFKLFGDSASIAAAPDVDPEDWKSESLWSVNCHRDKMTSARSCMASKGNLFIFFSGTGKVTISVGDDHFPGSITSIKVGNRRFDTTHRDGDFAQSVAILALMKNGAPVVTRYMKWPYRTWVDEEFSAYGLQSVAEVARWLIKNGKFD